MIMIPLAGIFLGRDAAGVVEHASPTKLEED